MAEPPIFAFIKLGQREHLEALRTEGILFLNTWDYFRGLEKDKQRGDPLEGTVGLFQAAKTQVLVGADGSSAIPLTHLIGQVKVSAGDSADYNVYCMFALTDTSHDHLKADEIEQFGGYAAIVLNGDEFLRRVLKTVREMGLPYNTGLVTYVEPEKHHGGYGPFTKPMNYSVQSEFRLLVRSSRKEPLLIRVGNLSDIIQVYPSKELQWRVRPM